MLNKKLLLSLAFLTGFSIMVIELTAARIIAPIIGSSIYTWTSIIGIILLGTSIGNHIGGKIIDKKNSPLSLAKALMAASLLTLYVPIMANLGTHIIYLTLTPFISAISLSIFIFISPAIAIGLIYPMLAKHLMLDTQKIGSDAGALSASLSAGSIAGTFLTGFFFIGYIGSMKTLSIVSMILLICSILIIKGFKNKVIYLVLYILLFTLYSELRTNINKNTNDIYSKESDYYTIHVADRKLAGYGETRILFLDADSHSMESLSNKKIDLYTNFYPIFSIFNDNIENIAVIGAGSLELSNNFKSYYPTAAVTTAEIDPEVVTTAKKYFRTSDYIVNNTVAQDGRIFLAGSNKQYDVIFSDAYNSFISVPWHLTTQEFFQLAKKRLNNDGIFAINFISAQTGENAALYESILTTFSSVFNNYHVFAYGKNEENVQNIIMLGINSDQAMTYSQLDSQIFSKLKDSSVRLINSGDQKKNLVLTDDFAPTDRLMMPSIRSYFKTYKTNFLYPQI
jgi:spermidine synthase